MGKSLYIAEKPSVAQEFAKALKKSFKRSDGYLESSDSIVTWCVGHLVTMSYPEAYHPSLKQWRLETLPFIPKEYKYQVIDGVKKQYEIVAHLLNREDVEVIYVCTDSGREGEYIYRLVEQMANVKGKVRKRVWIDSQTEEEILRGIEQAKDLSAYDNLAASAYLRAIEDYLMGINFSRLLTLRYGNAVSRFLGTKYTVVSVGRVMTCVLGMVVRREREIRNFDKKTFYRVLAEISCNDVTLQAEWKVASGSKYEGTPYLYKENGFLDKKKAMEFIEWLKNPSPVQATLSQMEKKKEKKNPPLLYNLAELQNACSKRMKFSPDQTLSIVQQLYEKKLVTYPRTDARVLSTAAAKEIYKNIKGLLNMGYIRTYAEQILENGSYRNLAKTRYVNDKQITDHYAIVPTGQGMQALKSLNANATKVYEMIVKRFVSIFFPPAVYEKYQLKFLIKGETFVLSQKVLAEPGYLTIFAPKASQATAQEQSLKEDADKTDKEGKKSEENLNSIQNFMKALPALKKNGVYPVKDFQIKEGETSPPKRYTSGSMILAMENAGQLIEDEELRAQIKGSGIGTSATRAEILKKLVSIGYLNLNQKTQVITPALLGELIYEVVNVSIVHLLNPELTASWEKGLTYVTEGTITQQEYMEKLEGFINRRTYAVLRNNQQTALQQQFQQVKACYKEPVQKKAKTAKKKKAVAGKKE